MKTVPHKGNDANCLSEIAACLPIVVRNPKTFATTAMKY